MKFLALTHSHSVLANFQTKRLRGDKPRTLLIWSRVRERHHVHEVALHSKVTGSTMRPTYGMRPMCRVNRKKLTGYCASLNHLHMTPATTDADAHVAL
ncbi:hypothetical protein V5799_022261 [Amblyomma americanum]|uniref:Uncharacterized protein n=1 Tax=Amblyomma americanum TaxID=6943 RepID=A0AAQ4FN17_AMBAM